MQESRYIPHYDPLVSHRGEKNMTRASGAGQVACSTTDGKDRKIPVGNYRSVQSEIIITIRHVTAQQVLDDSFQVLFL